MRLHCLGCNFAILSSIRTSLKSSSRSMYTSWLNTFCTLQSIVYSVFELPKKKTIHVNFCSAKIPLLLFVCMLVRSFKQEDTLSFGILAVSYSRHLSVTCAWDGDRSALHSYALEKLVSNKQAPSSIGHIAD